ncbi:Flp family type IVb pilin [Humibacillus xanthopallidus]|uniref:Pilus assembly protein Flp/PilA n=1 Tax=Humibacillus xanthopallidus TaxID=412689 RepID=A0A543I1W4_9MICO|nr:Flp family type IVb pilin [Humibacillus xanthopallidus]TQM64555.1 pilus assembly protein Flp/PilA [Humibacillus xanthopallidus]
MTKLVARLQTRVADDRGATMVEYALLVAFIALVALVGITILGTTLSSFFSSIAGQL